MKMRTIKNSILKVPRVERLIHGHLEIRYWAGPFQSWGCFISWWMNIYLLWRSLYAYVHIHAHIRTYALILKNIWNGCKWTMKKHRMKNKCEETKQKGLTDIMDNMFFFCGFLNAQWIIMVDWELFDVWVVAKNHQIILTYQQQKICFLFLLVFKKL